MDKEDALILCVCSSIVIFISVIILFICSICIIKPGEIGLYQLFGKLNKKEMGQGFHLVNPLSSIKRMTTKFNQITVDTSVLTEDNLNIQVEGTILYKLSEGKYKYVYSNFSDNIINIEKAIISPALQSSIREACAIMDWDTLSTHRENLRYDIAKRLSKILNKKGFTINNVMINDIQPPQRIKDAVMSKLKAQQEVVQMQFEQQKAKKAADIKIIEAKGIAKSQEIIQQRLTPLYVQYYAIQSYRQLANSKNSTFIIMPTDPKGAGMPMILNTK
jgi:regulator of protease activity HflC (stomatin/prohibitin superfamily)